MDDGREEPGGVKSGKKLLLYVKSIFYLLYVKEGLDSAELCALSFDILDDFQVENIQLCAFESNESTLTGSSAAIVLVAVPVGRG